MMKSSLVSGLALSAALTACASSLHNGSNSASAAPAAGTAVAAASTKTPKLICEDSTQIGSHMRQRVCLTPEQVEERHKAAQQMFNHDAINQCGQSGCNGGGVGGPPKGD